MTKGSHKIPTGVKGLDTIMSGGYPAASPTLLKGGPGTGKTLFCLSFARTQLGQGHAVVLVTCDESPDRLVGYMDRLGMAGSEHRESGRLLVLDFRPNLRATEVGCYDLTPILERIRHAVGSCGAKALVFDSLQNLLIGLGDPAPRQALLELFDWLREAKLTALLTASTGRSGGIDGLLEEYAADCVVHLSQHVANTLMTRYLRVLKYRGSSHGSNTFPFSVNDSGISLLPVTATRLHRKMDRGRMSTGVARLDDMLGGAGYIRGTSLMISGRAGSGKTILAATLTERVLRAGQKALYVSFEEGEAELESNLRSVGLELGEHVRSGRLLLHSGRAIERGLEDHLISIVDRVERHAPELVVLDPVTALTDMGSAAQVKMLMIRFLTAIKGTGATLALTELLPDASEDTSSLAVSSLVDTWLRLRQVESNGELNRLINVVKSRGSSTSNQVKEFTIGADGIAIEDPYVGDGELLVGSAKAARVAQDRAAAQRRDVARDELKRSLAALELTHESQLAVLRAEYEQQVRELTDSLAALELQTEQTALLRHSMESIRK